MIDAADIADAMIYLSDHPQEIPRIPSDQILRLAEARRLEIQDNPYTE